MAALFGTVTFLVLILQLFHTILVADYSPDSFDVPQYVVSVEVMQNKSQYHQGNYYK